MGGLRCGVLSCVVLSCAVDKICAFLKPFTFHNSFMFFASRWCFNHFFRFQAQLDFSKRCSMKSEKVLETAARSKKHETVVEGQRLRTTDIMERTCPRQFFLIK